MNGRKAIVSALLAGVLCAPMGKAWYFFRSDVAHPHPPEVPGYIVFAGDTVRFDRADLYERMDRELMAFTYMHTTSMLMLKRSARFFEQVVPILSRFGVPEDLKYLMVIESSLDPWAVSPAGAAGLWQFTRATALEYGLVVDNEVDERFHIGKETEAACRYLLKAYGKYGDWTTVAASYNAGQGGVSRRLEGQGRSSALDLWLPEETSRYMFRMMAAKLFFENPEDFGFPADMVGRYPYFPPEKQITVTGPVESLVAFADSNGVSYAELKRANPWLRDSKLVNKGRRTYTIDIPGKQRYECF